MAFSTNILPTEAAYYTLNNASIVNGRLSLQSGGSAEIKIDKTILHSVTSNILVNFFTSFIINNSDSLYKNLNLESLKKSKDSSTIYGKSIYDTPKYILISANLEKVINYISTLDVTINNIFVTLLTMYFVVLLRITIYIYNLNLSVFFNNKCSFILY